MTPIKVTARESARRVWPRWHEAACVRPPPLESRPARDPSPTAQVPSSTGPARSSSGENSRTNVQNVLAGSTVLDPKGQPLQEPLDRIILRAGGLTDPEFETLQKRLARML